MRKMLSIILAAGIIFGLTATAMAVQNPDYCYVIVKCTVTLSLDVGNDDVASSTYTVHLGTHAPGTDLLSGPIPVENDGEGSIVKISLQRTKCEINSNDDGTGTWSDDTGVTGWSWSSSFANVGTLKACLGVIFSSSTPTDTNWVSDDDIIEDPTYYRKNANSVLTGPHSPYTSALNSNSLNFVAYGEIRNMYVRLKLPTAVADQKPRRITITATAYLYESGD
jgi:hypothetical protein